MQNMAIRHLKDRNYKLLGSRSAQRLIVLLSISGVVLLTTCGVLPRATSWSFRSNPLRNASLNTIPSKIPGADMTPGLDAVRSATDNFQKVTVFCWPQTGGVWARDDCDQIELDFLDISSTEQAATERYSEAEDEFCQRLYQMGGRHHEFEGAYVIDSMRRRYNDELERYYGWPGAVPEDGVWAVWLTPFEITKLDAQHIRNASNMAERCEAIQRFGGRFYSDWDEMQQHVDTYSVETRRLLDEAEQRRKDRINYEPPGNRILPASSDQRGLM